MSEDLDVTPTQLNRDLLRAAGEHLQAIADAVAHQMNLAGGYRRAPLSVFRRAYKLSGLASAVLEMANEQDA